MAVSVYRELGFKNTIMIEPVGYLDMLYLTKNAKKVITDSGGLQKEAYILKTSCVTVRDQTEWVETLIGNNNILAKPQAADIYEKAFDTIIDTANNKDYFGKGDAAQKICSLIN
jgi:UDP-N-acetylglucosamine 2-epimerase (non-hydrolysing)/UDP-GlcNAc3NAcA epimerase